MWSPSKGLYFFVSAHLQSKKNVLSATAAMQSPLPAPSPGSCLLKMPEPCPHPPASGSVPLLSVLPAIKNTCQSRSDTSEAILSNLVLKILHLLAPPFIPSPPATTGDTQYLKDAILFRLKKKGVFIVYVFPPQISDSSQPPPRRPHGVDRSSQTFPKVLICSCPS